MPRRLRLLLLPLLLLAPAGCRSETSIDVRSVDEILVETLVSFTPAEAELVGVDSKVLCDELLMGVSSDSLSVEPQDGADHVGCRGRGSYTREELGEWLSLEDDVWTFHIGLDGLPSAPPQVDQVDMAVSVKFPGEVLSHNGSSTVSGTTVTWTDFDAASQVTGMTATGRAARGSGAVLMWGLLGAAGLAAAVAIGVRSRVIAPRRREDGAAPPWTSEQQADWERRAWERPAERQVWEQPAEPRAWEQPAKGPAWDPPAAAPPAPDPSAGPAQGTPSADAGGAQDPRDWDQARIWGRPPAPPDQPEPPELA